MNRTAKWTGTLQAMVIMCGVSLEAAPVYYTATALGTSERNISGRDINASGQVTGTSRDAGADSRAFIYSNGIMTDLGTLQYGGEDGQGPYDTYSLGNSINASGQVTGTSGVGPYAFFYSNGGIGSLGTVGGRESAGYGINDKGQVTGYSTIAEDDVYHAFIYGESGNGMTDLGTLGGTHSAGSSINNNGQVTGSSFLSGGARRFHAFLYSGGSMIDIGTLGGTESAGLDINDGGQITGSSSISGDAATHAFLYNNGSMIDLGTLGGTYSVGRGINAIGQVTGNSNLSESSVSFHAFLYRDGTMYDLNSLVSRGLRPGVYLGDAPGINDRGWIVANGSDGMAYLLQPTTAIPEPSSLALCGMGTCLLIVLRLRASNTNKLQ